MALAYLLDPVADRLERGGHEPLLGDDHHRAVTVGAGAALVGLIVVPLLVSQLAGFLERLPSYVAELRQLANRFLRDARSASISARSRRASGVDQVVAQGAAWLASVLALDLGRRPGADLNVVSLIVVTPVVAFYLLYDWDRMLARIDALMPREHVDTIRMLGRDIDIARSPASSAGRARSA